MIEFERRELPYSNGSIIINQYGEIMDSSGSIIKQTVSNQEHYVAIDWINGSKEYLVSLLVLYAFERVGANLELLENIEVLYADGCKNNLSPINLLYRFKYGKLEVPKMPGFYYVPFYTDYAITENGVMCNVATGRIKTWGIVKPNAIKNDTGGYSYTRVNDRYGRSKILMLHRALCFTFKPYGAEVFSLVVNHLDGNPKNNILDNLEWTTYSKNNQHAYGLELRPNAATPILVKDLKTGNIRRFVSIAECERDLGYSGLWCRLSNPVTTIHVDMRIFKYDDGSEWPNVDLNMMKINRSGLGARLVARNIFTGESIIFSNALAAEEAVCVKSATILFHLRNSSNRPVNGYLFRYLNDETPWPNFTSRHLQIFKKYPLYPRSGAIIKDITTGEEVFYPSTRDASEALNIDTTNFFSYAGKNKLYLKKYIISYFRLTDNLGPPIRRRIA